MLGISPRQRLKSYGLNIAALEDDQALQDDVLSVHHAMIITFSSTPAIKIIENDRGVAFIQSAQLAKGRCGSKGSSSGR
jgi:hypothetical protein